MLKSEHPVDSYTPHRMIAHQQVTKFKIKHFIKKYNNSNDRTQGYLIISPMIDSLIMG